MQLNILLTGIIFFIAVLSLHIIIWRILKDTEFFRKIGKMSALFGIFLLMPAIVFILLFFHSGNFFEVTASALLYFSLACAYIQTYPAVDVIAPSLKIVYLIHSSNKRGENGITEAQIASEFDYQCLIKDRIDDLFADKLVYSKDGRLYNTLKGKIIAEPFYFIRQIYGLGIGKG